MPTCKQTCPPGFDVLTQRIHGGTAEGYPEVDKSLSLDSSNRVLRELVLHVTWNSLESSLGVYTTGLQLIRDLIARADTHCPNIKIGLYVAMNEFNGAVGAKPLPDYIQQDNSTYGGYAFSDGNDDRYKGGTISEVLSQDGSGNPVEFGGHNVNYMNANVCTRIDALYTALAAMLNDEYRDRFTGFVMEETALNYGVLSQSFSKSSWMTGYEARITHITSVLKQDQIVWSEFNFIQNGNDSDLASHITFIRNGQPAAGTDTGRIGLQGPDTDRTNAKLNTNVLSGGVATSQSEAKRLYGGEFPTRGQLQTDRTDGSYSDASNPREDNGIANPKGIYTPLELFNMIRKYEDGAPTSTYPSPVAAPMDEYLNCSHILVRSRNYERENGEAIPSSNDWEDTLYPAIVAWEAIAARASPTWDDGTKSWMNVQTPGAADSVIVSYDNDNNTAGQSYSETGSGFSDNGGGTASVGNSGGTASGDYEGNSTTRTASITTTAGSNRKLVARITGLDSSNSDLTITHVKIDAGGGDEATFTARVQNNRGAGDFFKILADIYDLDDTDFPASDGAYTVTVTFNGSVKECHLEVTQIDDVTQGAPADTATAFTNNTTAWSDSMTAGAAGSIALTCFQCDDEVNDLAPDSGTEDYEIGDLASAQGESAGSYNTGVASGSASYGWTSNNSDAGIMAGIVYSPASSVTGRKLQAGGTGTDYASYLSAPVGNSNVIPSVGNMTAKVTIPSDASSDGHTAAKYQYYLNGVAVGAEQTIDQQANAGTVVSLSTVSDHPSGQWELRSSDKDGTTSLYSYQVQVEWDYDDASTIPTTSAAAALMALMTA